MSTPGRSRNPASAEAARILQQGIELQRRKQFAQAEYCFQAVLQKFPEHPEALNLMGTLACEAKRFDVAIDLLERAVKTKPKDVRYRTNLGNAYNLADRPGKAVVHLRRAVSAQPRLFEAQLNLGRAYRKQGKAQKALEAFDRALAARPTDKTALNGRAHALMDYGRADEARSIFRSILEQHPGDGRALNGLANVRKFEAEDEDLSLILSALERDDVSESNRSVAHYSAGKIYNDLERYDNAFEHFIAANALRSKGYRVSDFSEYVDRLIGLFTPMFLRAHERAANASSRPVFIVGMPRSGTTLTEQIIASHSKAHGAGELRDMGTLLGDITEGAPWTSEHFFDRLRKVADETLATLAKRYLSTLKRLSPSAARIVDKMPHNFELLGLISILFPNAHVIHCRRDPMDNCVSCFTHRFVDAHAYSVDLNTLGCYYREYHRLMAYWSNVLPLAILDLRYEDMVADQEAQSRRLIEFLGLDWEDACLNYHKTERSVQTLSHWQVRQPIYTTSVKRWQRYDRHLKPLKRALGDLFEDES